MQRDGGNTPDSKARKHVTRANETRGSAGDTTKASVTLSSDARSDGERAAVALFMTLTARVEAQLYTCLLCAPSSFLKIAAIFCEASYATTRPEVCRGEERGAARCRRRGQANANQKNEGSSDGISKSSSGDVKTTRMCINGTMGRVQRANNAPDALMPRAAATYGCALASRIANQGKSCEGARSSVGIVGFSCLFRAGLPVRARCLSCLSCRGRTCVASADSNENHNRNVAMICVRGLYLGRLVTGRFELNVSASDA